MAVTVCRAAAPKLPTIALLVAVVLLHADRLDGFAPSSAEHSIGDNFNVPCKYMDSISTAELNAYAQLVGNANWTTLANATSPAAPIGYYDYAIAYGAIRRPVARHQRVCVCHHQPCVRLRCARGMTFDEDTGICSANEHVRDPSMVVMADNGIDRQTVGLFEHFGYTVGGACEEMTPLVPDEIKTDAWEMDVVCSWLCCSPDWISISIRFQNGNVVLKNRVLTQHQYSMYMRWNQNSSQVEIVILACLGWFDNHNRFDILPYGECIVHCNILSSRTR